MSLKSDFKMLTVPCLIINMIILILIIIGIGKSTLEYANVFLVSVALVK